jgi:predicted ATPase with chaperone activity
MSLAVLYSRALSGVEAALVTVEVHSANGLPNFTIVGLPETEVKESEDRVRATLQNCQFDFPAQFQLIAAMNPCPCGYHGHYNWRCRCTPDQISR